MTNEDQFILDDIRSAVAKLCSRFPDQYWRELDRARAYPSDFVDAANQAGYSSIMIPEKYGGAGLGIRAASVVVEEINRQGGVGSAIHAQMFMMGIMLRHGSEEQRQIYLPDIAAGKLRMLAFSITEPNVGTDTTRITTKAELKDGKYVLYGQKVFTSRIEYSDLMLVLARTKPINETARPADGLSLFLCDLRESRKNLEFRKIDVMFNHHTYEVFFDGYEIPEDSLIGVEGEGFRYLLDGLNAERILVSAECVGDGRWFIDRSVQYANDRVVFGRPIGQNQGVQFPIARAHVNVEAADLMRWRAATLFDDVEPCGKEANMAKLLASEASWEAANVAMQTHGGNGVATEFDIERKFRETRVFQLAPVSTNMILAYVGQKVLGLPRSY